MPLPLFARRFSIPVLLSVIIFEYVCSNHYRSLLCSDVFIQMYLRRQVSCSLCEREFLNGAKSLYSQLSTIIAAFPSLISSFSHARVSCKLAAVYRVHRAPRVYGVSCRLTPGKPPGRRRVDGGRWGGGIGLGEESQRGKRPRCDLYTYFLPSTATVAITLAIVCSHELICRDYRNILWKSNLR